MELEANLSEEGTDVYGEYTPLTARDILVKDIDELKVTGRRVWRGGGMDGVGLHAADRARHR